MGGNCDRGRSTQYSIPGSSARATPVGSDRSECGSLLVHWLEQSADGEIEHISDLKDLNRSETAQLSGVMQKWSFSLQFWGHWDLRIYKFICSWAIVAHPMPLPSAPATTMKMRKRRTMGTVLFYRQLTCFRILPNVQYTYHRRSVFVTSVHYSQCYSSILPEQNSSGFYRTRVRVCRLQKGVSNWIFYSNLLDSSLDSTSGPAAFEATAKDLEKVAYWTYYFNLIFFNYLIAIHRSAPAITTPSPVRWHPRSPIHWSDHSRLVSFLNDLFFEIRLKMKLPFIELIQIDIDL